jgi:hypothetical protein
MLSVILLNATYKPLMLSVVMLSVVMLSTRHYDEMCNAKCCGTTNMTDFFIIVIPQHRHSTKTLTVIVLHALVSFYKLKFSICFIQETYYQEWSWIRLMLCLHYLHVRSKNLAKINFLGRFGKLMF